jgi:tRNA synthetases class I (I, L, M and V)/Protein of unknown function (DUF835)/Anticodon-binding domain of tRNA ligase
MPEPSTSSTSPAGAVEAEVRELWRSRHLPPSDGYLGPTDAPLARLLEGTFVPGDPLPLVAHRAVAADVEARFLSISGWRVLGTLRAEAWSPGEIDPAIPATLAALGVWVGGDGAHPWDASDRRASVQAIVDRLAARGAIVARDAPLRFCLRCGEPRSPERTIYQEEIGDTYLVRFPLDGSDPPVEALAWLDAPWRVLGTSALLVNPDLPYATVQYKRKEATARLLTSRSSLARLRAWLPGTELELVDEKPGRDFVGRSYAFPLRHEFPMGGSLAAPAGTVQAVPDVGDSGTGIVPLVPAHGGTDAVIAGRLGVPGWPLLTPHGRLDPLLTHKYAGLDLATANEFVARDLTEAGAVLARLRVLRGVPYCSLCGHALVWMPGRAWCLEPGRLPAEQKERYARLLPHDRPITQIEVTPWPVSLTSVDVSAEAIRLSECGRCDKLAPAGPERACSCGGNRRTIGRRLVPSIAGTFSAWARNDPLSPGDTVRIYASDRRRVPALVHHLAALTGMNAAVAEVGLTILPTLPDVDVRGLVGTFGADAVRAAFVRTDASEAATGNFRERCRQEARRLAKLLEFARGVLENAGSAGAADLRPADAGDRDAAPEDRAILARWQRVEVQVVGAYEKGRAADAYRHLARFVERDLAEYTELVRPRLTPGEPAGSRRAALRTLASLGRSIAIGASPIAPFTAEAVHRLLTAEPRSLTEEEELGGERAPADASLIASWDRWGAVVRAADRFRRDHRLPPGAILAHAVVVLANDREAEPLRADRARLERMARVSSLEVTSPGAPWTGRRRRLVPVESEIQRAYPDVATQVVHLLQRLPERRAEPGGEVRGMTVVVRGVTRAITPEMLTYEETLPDRFVPTPFSLGEMYVELPAGTSGPTTPPPLSPDGFWLLRRLERLLRRAGAPDRTRIAVVRAVDPLASEIRSRAEAIARYLGIASVDVREPAENGGGGRGVSGRTRSGARWTVSVAGVAAGSRPVKHREARTRGRRVPEPTPDRPDDGADGIDYADESVIATAQAVRDLGEALDNLLGAPLLGPTKVALARDAGFRSLEELSAAPFDAIEQLPGFGRPVAGVLWTKLGRRPPPPPPRPRRERRIPVPEPTPPAVIEPRPIVPLPEAVPVAPSSTPAATALPEIPEPPPSVPPAPHPVEPSVVPIPLPPPVPAPLPPVVPEAPLPTLAAVPPPAPPPEPEAPPPPPPAEPPPPPPVGLEIVIASSVREALDPFLDATAAGRHGIAIVREMPDRVRIHVGPRPVVVYWLTNIARDRTVRPSDLAGISDRVRGALATEGVTAVFLEGIEYLTRIHGIDRVVELLRALDHDAKEHEARIWLHLTPSLLSPPDLERLLNDLGGTPPAAPPDAEAPAPP